MEGRTGYDQVQETISAIWRDLLHLADIGPNDDFIALGGDSLLAMEMTFRVHEAFQLIDTAEVILGIDEGATLNDLGRYIAARRVSRPGR